MAVANYKAVPFFDMVEGLNTMASAIRLKPTECRDVQNMIYFPIGGFSKRNGYATLNSAPVVTGAGCTGLYMARFTTSGGTNLALLVAGKKIYKMAADLGGTWTDITGGLTITDTDNNHWNFAQLNDVVVLGNGDNDACLQVSSAGAASTLAPGPFTKFLFPLEARGYMFYFQPTVSGTLNPDRCYFSDINDATTVGTNNFIDVAKGQGGDIRGAVEYKTFVYIFKRHGIYQLNYQPTRVNSSGTAFPWNEFPNPIVPGVGTQSHRSIVKFTTPSTHATPGEELVFFVDQFGMPRIFDGRMTISFASKISDSRDSTILSLSDMDKTRTKYIHAVNYPEKNYLMCHMSDTNSQEDTCWILDYSVGFSLGRFKFNLPFNVSALFEKSNGTFKPFFGDYNGQVYEYDSGTTDDGAPIEDYYITGDTSLRTYMLRSKWHMIDLRGQNGSTSQKTKISFYLDGQDAVATEQEISLATTQTQWGSFTWGQASWAKKGMLGRTLEINHEAKTLRTKIESVDKDVDTLKMEGWTLVGEELGTSQN